MAAGALRRSRADSAVSVTRIAGPVTQRILEQRRFATYTGRIAQNASFLIQFLLTLAISPTVHVDRLPVKMWGRYLPDTFSAAYWRLFGHEHEVPPEEVYGGNSLDPLS